MFSSTVAKDLWANLFAAIIAVLLIDRIVKASELQKSEPSLRFVKDRIGNVCHVLSIGLWWGADWRTRLDDNRLSRYHESFYETKEWAIQKIETLLDKYGYLLETELRNDIFDLVSILRDYVWLRIEAKAPTRKDFLILYHMENVASAVINQSKSLGTMSCGKEVKGKAYGNGKKVNLQQSGLH